MGFRRDALLLFATRPFLEDLDRLGIFLICCAHEVLDFFNRFFGSVRGNSIFLLAHNRLRMSFQSQRFAFTINNYSDEELALCRTVVQNTDVSYICFGLEIGESGTPHIQGYLELTKKKRASTVNRLLGNRAHLEVAKGSADDNQKYTSKTREEDPNPNAIWEEYGEINPRLGQKRKREENLDFQELVSFIQTGSTVQDIICKFPELAIKYLPNICKVRDILTKDDSLAPFFGPYQWATPPGFGSDSLWRRCLWLKGASGIGKTQFACSLIDRPLFVRHIDCLKKFNPTDHGGIIFDDMNFTHWPREAQICLLDCEMPTAIHVRYGVVQLPAYTKRIFTSNVDIFLEDPAILRRIHRVNFNTFP